MDKNQIRTQLKEKRLSLPQAERAAADLRACQALMKLLGAYRTVAFYSPIRGEADPTQAAQAFIAGGGKALYPRVTGESMVMAEGDRQAGAFGIAEPTGQAYVGAVDAVVVPLLAVDKRGNRLGWGKGYYDRYFADHPCQKIGFCYDFQVVDEVAADVWDIPLSVVVTDRRVIQGNKENETIL